VSVVIVGVIRRKPVLTHASIVCEGMLASVNSVNSVPWWQVKCSLPDTNCQHDGWLLFMFGEYLYRRRYQGDRHSFSWPSFVSRHCAECWHRSNFYR